MAGTMAVLDKNLEALDLAFEEIGEVIEYRHPVHGKIVDVRFDSWRDVTVYEDGYEESFYIGD